MPGLILPNSFHYPAPRVWVPRAFWSPSRRCCCVTCPWCSGTIPEQYQVVISGVTDWLPFCDECDEKLNDTFVLDQYGDFYTGTSCCWRYELPSAVCTDVAIAIEVWIQGDTLVVYATDDTWPNTPTNGIQWKEEMNGGVDPWDCEITNASISYFTEVRCRGSGSTCLVTAL
jgi:hypothetical protein